MKIEEPKIKEINEKSKLFEKELLGIVFYDNSKSVNAKALISLDDLAYYRPHFETFLDCFINNKNLTSEFGSKNIQLSEFANEFSRRNIEDVCRDIKEVAKARRVYEVLERSVSLVTPRGVPELVTELHQKLVKASRDSNEPVESITSLISDFRERQGFYQSKFESGGGIIGLSTGYKELDDVIDGIRPEHLWIIGAYTSMGKTFAALNIVASLIKQKKRVVFYSIEMSSIDILSRLVGIMTGQSGLFILKNMPHDKEKVTEALKQIEESGLTIIAGGKEISQISFSSFEEQMKAPVDLFVVDFLQLVTVKGARSDYETTTTAILEIQNMAKKLHTPFVVLSQVSNESAKVNDAVVMGFKGSGAIAAAADFAFEICINEENKARWKEKMKLGEEVKMRWNIRKNRHGKGGFIDMLFLGQTGVFRIDTGEVDWGDWADREKKRLSGK